MDSTFGVSSAAATPWSSRATAAAGEVHQDTTGLDYVWSNGLTHQVIDVQSPGRDRARHEHRIFRISRTTPVPDVVEPVGSASRYRGCTHIVGRTPQQPVEEAAIEVIEDLVQVVGMAARSVQALAPAHLADELRFIAE